MATICRGCLTFPLNREMDRLYVADWHADASSRSVHVSQLGCKRRRKKLKEEHRKRREANDNREKIADRL